MEVKKSTLQIIAGIFVFTIIIALVLLGAISQSKNDSGPTTKQPTIENAEIKDGDQVLDLTAKVGYTPNFIEAKANQNTVLRVNTKGTYDCSLAFTIPKLGIRKNLPATGTTNIGIGSFKPGEELVGTCSMGMYSFKIKFS